MKKIIILLTSMMLSACASMRESYIAENCNSETMYSHGMNDARQGEAMQTAQRLSLCLENQKDQLGQSYRTGYEAGLKANQDDLQATRPVVQLPTERSSGTTIRIGRGGIEIGSGETQPSSQSVVVQSNPKAWFCEVSAFTQHYEAFGPTQLEAKQAVKESCTNEHHQMHCDEIKCKTNR